MKLKALTHIAKPKSKQTNNQTNKQTNKQTKQKFGDNFGSLSDTLKDIFSCQRTTGNWKEELRRKVIAEVNSTKEIFAGAVRMRRGWVFWGLSTCRKLADLLRPGLSLCPVPPLHSLPPSTSHPSLPGPACHCGKSRLPSLLFTSTFLTTFLTTSWGPACHCGRSRLPSHPLPSLPFTFQARLVIVAGPAFSLTPTLSTSRPG